ncbi:unnamed protein product [Closterium sp. Naga37s-1]|nr:unnamed protein product [Closterium sp. Naga37s-1]
MAGEREGVPSDLEQRLQRAWMHVQLKTCRIVQDHPCGGHQGAHTHSHGGNTRGGGQQQPSLPPPQRTARDLTATLQQLWGNTQEPLVPPSDPRQPPPQPRPPPQPISYPCSLPPATSGASSQGNGTASPGPSASSSSSHSTGLTPRQHAQPAAVPLNSAGQPCQQLSPSPSTSGQPSPGGSPAACAFVPGQAGGGSGGVWPRHGPNSVAEQLRELSAAEWMARVQQVEPVALGAEYMEADFFRGLDELTFAFDEMESLLPHDLNPAFLSAPPGAFHGAPGDAGMGMDMGGGMGMGMGAGMGEEELLGMTVDRMVQANPALPPAHHPMPPAFTGAPPSSCARDGGQGAGQQGGGVEGTGSARSGESQGRADSQGRAEELMAQMQRAALNSPGGSQEGWQQGGQQQGGQQQGGQQQQGQQGGQAMQQAQHGLKGEGERTRGRADERQREYEAAVASQRRSAVIQMLLDIAKAIVSGDHLRCRCLSSLTCHAISSIRHAPMPLLTLVKRLAAISPISSRARFSPLPSVPPTPSSPLPPLLPSTGARAGGAADSGGIGVHVLVERLTAVASVYGDATQRVSAYFLEGLLARASGTAPTGPGCPGSDGAGAAGALGIYRSIDCDAPLLRAFEVLVSASPYLTFGHVACNSAILEAIQGARKVHIVDFGLGHAVQWPPLIQALAVLPGGPPHLRITGIDRPFVAGIHKGYCLRQAGQRLRKVAQSWGVPFTFNFIPINLPDLQPSMVRCEADEVLVVNCALRLHNLMDESVTPSNPRAAVLRTMRALAPAVTTLVEQNTNHNSPFFLSRFLEALHYYASIFDALDASVPADSTERRLFEQRVLGRAIVNVVACEGQDRTERQEPLGQWERRVHRAGFVGYPLSREVVATATALLSTGCLKRADPHVSCAFAPLPFHSLPTRLEVAFFPPIPFDMLLALPTTVPDATHFEIPHHHQPPSTDLGPFPCRTTMATLGHRSVSLPQLHPWIRGVDHEERASEAALAAQCGEPSDVPVRMHSNRPDDQRGQQQQQQVQQQEQQVQQQEQQVQEEEVQQERQQREEQQQQQSTSAVLGPRSVAVSLTVDHAFGFASPAALPPAVLSALAALADSARHQAGGFSPLTAEGTADGALPPALEGILRSAPPAGPGDAGSVDGPAVAERYGQWSGESGSYSMLLPADAPAVAAATVGAADRASPSETQQAAATAASQTAASTGASASVAATAEAAVAVEAQAASVERLQGAPAGKASSRELASAAPAAVPAVVAAEAEAAAGEAEEGAEAELLAVEVRWKGARAGLMGSMFGRAVKRGCSSAQPPRGPHGMVRWEEGFAHDCHLLPCPAALRAARGQGEACGKGCLFQPWEVVLLVYKHAPSRPRERPQQVASVVLDVAPLAAPLSTQPLTHHLLLLFAPPDSPPVGLLQVTVECTQLPQAASVPPSPAALQSAAPVPAQASAPAPVPATPAAGGPAAAGTGVREAGGGGVHLGGLWGWQRRSRESKSPALPLDAAGRAGEGEGHGAAGSGSAEQSSGGGQQEEADWVQGGDGDTEWEQVKRRASDGEEGESGLGGQGMGGRQASSAVGVEAAGGGGDGQRGVGLSAGNTPRHTGGAVEQQGAREGAGAEGEGESLADNKGAAGNGDASGGADTGAGASTEVNLGGHVGGPVHTRMRMLHLLPHALPSPPRTLSLPAQPSSAHSERGQTAMQEVHMTPLEAGREGGGEEGAVGAEVVGGAAEEEQRVIAPLRSPLAPRLFTFTSTFLFFSSTPRPPPAPAATPDLPSTPAPQSASSAQEATSELAPAACAASTQGEQGPPPAQGSRDSSPISPLDPLPADVPPPSKPFLLPPFLPAKPLAATSGGGGAGGGGGGGAGVGAFLRRPLLFLRTLSLQERGEPLLHKAYGEEGGDEIDWDRRKALEAEQEHPLYKLPLEEQQAASAGEAEAEAVSPSASSVRELFGDEFRVGQWERREVVSRDGAARLCAPVFLATVDQCHASAAGEGACALLVAHIAAWVHLHLHAHGEGTLPGQAELDDLIRAGSADWRRLRALSDFHQRFPDGHFDLDTVLAAVQHSHSDTPPLAQTDRGGQAVGAEVNKQAADKDGGGNTDPGASHDGSSSGSSDGGGVARMPRLPLCVVPSQSFVGFFHPPCLAARRAKEDAARTQGSSAAEGDAADVNRGEAGASTVDKSGRDTEEGGEGKEEEVVGKRTSSSPDVEAKGNGAEAPLETGKQEQTSTVESPESVGEKGVEEKGVEEKGVEEKGVEEKGVEEKGVEEKALEQLAFLEGMLSFDDIWEAVVQAGEGVYIVAWNDHFFLLLLRRSQPHPHQYRHQQQHGCGGAQAALDRAVGEHTGEGAGHGGTWAEARGGEVECVVIDTLGERLHEGCSQAFMLLFDSSSWVDVGLPLPAALGSTAAGGAGTGGGAGGAGDGGGGQAKAQGTGDSSEQKGRADEAERAEGKAGGIGAQVPKVETGRRWGVKAGKGSGKGKDGSGKGKGSSGMDIVAGGVGAHPHGVNDTVSCEAGAAKGEDVIVGAAQGTHVAEVEGVVLQAMRSSEGVTLLPADTHGVPAPITATPNHVDSPSADTCSPPCGDESASTAADSVIPTAVHAAEATCLLTHTDGPSRSPIHETKTSTTNFDGCASSEQPTQTASSAAGSSPACTATATSPPTSAAPACGGEGEGEAAPVAAGRRVWGAEACREYLKAFLAAVPLAEVEGDLRKGLLASPEAIHRRLQVELHFTRLL